MRVIDLTITNWRLSAQYMIDKRTAGLTMVQEEQKYLNDSLGAVSLPNQMYTDVINYEDTMVAARSLSDQGSTWVTA